MTKFLQRRSFEDFHPLSDQELELINSYWRAANYLSVGQIYLLDNPLLKTPLKIDHVKPRLLGHWGTTPGLNMLYVHLNRLIKKHLQSLLLITGPGHGGPAIVANNYLEGTYTTYYPNISEDAAGMRALFKQFSFPGGIPSHVSPEVPGSIHEGGELGYSLSHACGAAFDNPDLMIACVIGDGEAETGPLATSWHVNKYLNPKNDGAVLPILHLNGYKIAGPTLLSRIPQEELESLMIGYGYRPYLVEGSDPGSVHQQLAAALDQAYDDISKIWKAAREEGHTDRPIWPMIIFKTPKGWTGPKSVDDKKVEGSWRAHQVPLAEMASKPEHVQLLESWMRSYRPEELFDDQGALIDKLRQLAPPQHLCIGANPHANGGILLKDLKLPDFSKLAVAVKEPGVQIAEATRIMGNFLRDVMQLNDQARNFRLFGPDETASNRLSAVWEVTKSKWLAEIETGDEHLAREGRVVEMLSEHTCQGWLEGYLLTGRHGFFSCYEAFIHIIGSMFNQHAKWLKVTTKEIAWRRPIASLNYLLTSHVWRQDHNGFSHQDPGFIDHVVNKKSNIIRVYLPPDANTLLCVTDQVLRSRNCVNLVVCGKQPALQYLSMDAAIKHCSAGIGIWDWASSDRGHSPDVVMACCGDVPTLETLAAVSLLRHFAPNLKIRVINIVDLMTLQPKEEHPHGLSNRDFDALFTKDRPIVFAYHGYPWLIHRLTYRRSNHGNLHVRGYKEEGSTTTPFDMVVRNELDRFHLVCDVVDRVEALSDSAAYIKQEMRDKLIEHRQYIQSVGDDMPSVRDWKWT